MVAKKRSQDDGYVNPRKIVFTDDQKEMISRLAGIGCNVEQIAYILNVSASTFKRRVNEDEGLSELLEKGRAVAGSEVLNTAFKMATSGNSPWMTGFWLKCRLGWKEPKDPVDKDEKDFNLSYSK